MEGLKQAALGHWQTTVLGWGGGAALALLPVLESGRLPTGEQVLAAGLFAALGTLAKYGGKGS